MYDLLTILISEVGVRKDNIRGLYKFIEETEEEIIISRTLDILKICFSYKPSVPHHYFYFSGEGSGLEIDLSANP